ncbi:MAG: Transcription initiation factor TFIID subunit 12 [Ramalina farinacea]|uniref:Transcription initiation factor TFIID subunit 12 n=1 Tax=Ramalina farinacea TaxID=258253 RepID=A0AA43QI72_9LECA|nr:Transcription initiation factor TFIID subunit 12 [Ramalina farinacea]
MNNNPTTTQAQRIAALKNLVKPDAIPRLPSQLWPEETKTKYFTGVTSLWNAINTSTPDSPQWMNAFNKLVEVTKQIRSMMAKNSGRPTSSDQQMPMSQQAPQLSHGQPQLQQQPQPQSTQAKPAAPAGSGEQGRTTFSQRVIDKVKSHAFVIPPEIQRQGEQASQKCLSDMRMKYANALQKYETFNDRMTQMDNAYRNRQNQGNPFPPHEQEKFQIQRNSFELQREEVRHQLENFVEAQKKIKQDNPQLQTGGVATTMPEAMKREASQNGNPPAVPPQDQQSQAHTVSSALDAARKSIGSASAMSPTHPSASVHNTVNQQPNLHSTTQNNAQHPPAHSNLQNESRLPNNQYNSPRPTALSQSQPDGQVVPLTRESAVQQARSFSQSGMNPSFGPADPQSATQHGHPASNNIHTNNTHREPQQQQQHQQQQQQQQPLSGNHPKMPIPKDLNIPPPQPVSMGQARPTMSNGPHVPGPIGQPAIQKHPGYVLEGEGERVLSKKKLEELVRQVTGSTEADGNEGETLTAEVEEILLQVADDFVDQVIVAACKLAKLRSSSQLELRDLQLILERNYNIRVPGFASDEIRAVRKVAPTVGWTQKLSAVQAAKVTGGKAE